MKKFTVTVWKSDFDYFPNLFETLLDWIVCDLLIVVRETTNFFIVAAKEDYNDDYFVKNLYIHQDII